MKPVSLISDLLSSDNPCIIAGDFNLPDICWSSESSSFCDFVFQCNRTQHNIIVQPTHIKGNMLDLVLLNAICQLQSLAKGLQLAGVEGQMDGKLCSSGEGGTDGEDLPVCICMCGSAHDCGCVVDGSNAMAAS